MNCIMGTGVYLRANGNLNCWCGPGEHVDLGSLPLDGGDWNFVDDYYLSQEFLHVRKALAEGALPFPVRCLKCYYFDFESAEAPVEAPREIELMHLEAASVCNLRCPYCVHGDTEVVKSPVGPKFLPFELYSKVMHDIADAGMNIKSMYFSGRGEPGLHPQLWDMVALAKGLFRTNFMVATNGNIPFDPKIIDSGLDKLKIAMDNLDQDVYSAYRIGGDVNKLMRLTEAVANEKSRRNASNPDIIWQKVIFNFNADAAELEKYQQKAVECGVDSIRLVTAFTKEYPKETLASYKTFFPDVELADGSERDHITYAEMEERRSQAFAAKDRAGLVTVVVEVLGWFGFGVESRVEEDFIYGLDIADHKLYARRSDDRRSSAFIDVVGETLSNLSSLYEEAGDFEQARLYRGWADSVASLVLE